MADQSFFTEPVASTDILTWLQAVTVGVNDARLKTVSAVSSGPVAIPNAGAVDIYRADTTSAGFTINLPATPVDGETYEFANAGTNTLTIGRNGKNINGAASDVTIVTQWDGLRLTYDSTSGEWWSRP